jgi:protein-disulfide isomerase
MRSYPDDGQLGRFRPALEIIATLMVIVASTAVIWVTVSAWHGRASGVSTTGVPTTTPSGPVPPNEPQTLEGAQLLGSMDARVAIIEYSDFQCPFCARFSKNTWPLIKKEYVDTGRVLRAFRHLPSDGASKTAAVSAECAAQQGKFWEMHDGLYRLDGNFDELTGASLARRFGLEMAAFDRCLKGDVVAKIDNDTRTARSLRLLGTPTFLIGRVAPDRSVTVSHVLLGAESFDRFKDIFDQLLTQGDQHSRLRLFSR